MTTSIDPPDVNDVTEHALDAGDTAALVDFATRLEALVPDAWDRIGSRCAALDSPDFAALVRRAERRSGILVSAMMSRLGKRGVPPRPTAVAAAAVTGLGVVAEIVAEFEPPLGKAWIARRDRARAYATPEKRARSEAWLAISTMAEARRGDHPGITAAIHGAALSLLFRRHLSETEVVGAYAPFEAEIPLATLGRAGAAGASGAPETTATAGAPEGGDTA